MPEDQCLSVRGDDAALVYAHFSPAPPARIYIGSGWLSGARPWTPRLRPRDPPGWRDVWEAAARDVRHEIIVRLRWKERDGKSWTERRHRVDALIGRARRLEAALIGDHTSTLVNRLRLRPSRPPDPLAA